MELIFISNGKNISCHLENMISKKLLELPHPTLYVLIHMHIYLVSESIKLFMHTCVPGLDVAPPPYFDLRKICFKNFFKISKSEQ